MPVLTASSSVKRCRMLSVIPPVDQKKKKKETADSSISMEEWKKMIQASCGKVRRSPGFLWRTIWEVGRDDRRRAVHALKVGVTLTFVSLLYLLGPYFQGLGHNSAMSAVFTVAVVLEYTAGATLCKGVNKGIGTVLAGLLAFFLQFIAEKTGKLGRTVFIGFAVLLIGSASAYLRFIPYVKKNFDFAVVMFILTSSMITLSSSPMTQVMYMALQCLSAIAIGSAICLVVTLFVFPIWSGEDLHDSTVNKLEGLSKSVEACVNEYFSDDEKEMAVNNKSPDDEDPIYVGYRAVLDSKPQDETLALHASWEPRHSRDYRYPWQQYVKVGDALRHFCYTTVALHGCLQAETQNPKCCRDIFKDPCIRIANEESKALMELANSVRNRRHCSPEILSDHIHEALVDLNIALKSQPRLSIGSNSSQSNGKLEKETMEQCKIATTSLELSEVLPAAAFSFMLAESVARLDKVIEEVEELCRMAHFKDYQPSCDEVVLSCETETPREEVNVAGNHLAAFESIES